MKNSPFGHPAWIEIDLVQFKKNIAYIKKFIGSKTKFCLPVKANAYGHGLIPIAQAAAQAGVDYLGVSCLQEGALLRQANIKLPILVFGAIHTEQIKELIHYGLEFTIASLFKAKMVKDICEGLNKTVKVHLEIDTGMLRTGVRVTTGIEVLNFLKKHSCFKVKGIYSHLATADDLKNDFTLRQIELFKNFIADCELDKKSDYICHLANSAGLINFPTSHFEMVRPGLLAFGYYPNENIPTNLNKVLPCLNIKAKVSYFKIIKKGDGLGYNHTFIAPKDTRIITIPLGYGDGLRRSLSNKAQILLNGKRYPIVGNICMDQFMVDIGDDSAYVGDIITIIGNDQNESITIKELSNLCETIPYEILCGFNNRLPRLYQSEKGNLWEHEVYNPLSSTKVY